MSFRHNKKRNSGLVYEFLIRRMASTMVNRDPEKYLKAVGIVKKYFSPGQPLAREKEIFDAVVKNRGMTEASARRLISQIHEHVKNLDSRKVEIKKSNLIKDVNYAFGQDFFTVHRVPEYRLFASVQMMIEQIRQGSNVLAENVERIQLEESLVRFLVAPLSESPSKSSGREVDGLAAALAMRKFEERYSGVLTEAQKKTVRRYMNYSMIGNKEQFNREMEEERAGLLKKIRESSALPYFKADQVMSTRLDEAVTRLSSIKDLTTDSAVQELMLYHKLSAEIDADE